MLCMLMHDEDESNGDYVDDVDNDIDDHDGVTLCTHSSA